jgi:hypothetical protein
LIPSSSATNTSVTTQRCSAFVSSSHTSKRIMRLCQVSTKTRQDHRAVIGSNSFYLPSVESMYPNASF